ncbi:MAG TPA: EAL domain-containing protein [Steroidobacteraceae bacterium]|nr:EAL domain-containing protein [Steroidobacteraceae bacterium]
MAVDADVAGPLRKSANLQIVIVEDSAADAELVARSLSRAGLSYSLHRVQTESEFVSALSDNKPNLIISDFSLPQFDGLRALEIATASAPEVPFIFVSGTIGEERAIEALKRGATDYVLKSNLSRLPAAVDRALRESALQAAQRQLERERRDQEERLQRLTRSYRMLSITGSVILRVHDRRELLNELCRIAVEHGGYDRVVIGLMDPKEPVLRLRASAGLETPLLRAVDQTVLDSIATSASWAARVMRDGTPVFCDALAGDAFQVASRDVLLSHGLQSLAALPLRVEGRTIGVLTLLSRRRAMFDAAEIEVLRELTANLSFALQYLEKDEAVHFLSHFDGLTGLAKRSLFCQRLAHLLEADARDKRSRTVVVFDVQKLARINDSLGRDTGDRLIEGIAARLKEGHPAEECSAYFGGGTFVLTVPHISFADTGRLMQNPAAQLFVQPFLIEGRELRPAIRSGVAFYPHDASDAEALVQNAEAALKAAREDNEKYLMYGLVRERPTSKTFALEARLTGALGRQEFLLHYQPKIEIASGALVGLEALLRWRDSEEGLVAPSWFIPVLERSGAIVEVGEWVMQRAIEDLEAWSAAGLVPLRVAVNVSAVQLKGREFVPGVLRCIGSLARGRTALDIEITESMLMQDMESSTRKLRELREAGVGVAIDDFGTGYSSLGLLGRLPVDTLKVDRTFIQNIATSPQELTLVSTIISLAHAFDMSVVAEGVETLEQLQLLSEARCDQAQGFYLARPSPAPEIPSLVARLSQRKARIG